MGKGEEAGGSVSADRGWGREERQVAQYQQTEGGEGRGGGHLADSI